MSVFIATCGIRVTNYPCEQNALHFGQMSKTRHKVHCIYLPAVYGLRLTISVYSIIISTLVRFEKRQICNIGLHIFIVITLQKSKK